ncbi:MAG: hypothetical protein J1F36_02020 [Clostridiales bacterium]|nr:hypothetical protein [Clostridiales bacterium]
MSKLKSEHNIVAAEMLKLDMTYTDEGYFIWGYVLPIETGREGKFDGVTLTRYSVAQYEEMGHTIEVYYMFENGKLISYDKDYVERFKPATPSSGILVLLFASAFVGLAVYYAVRALYANYVRSHGEESIGRFEEATPVSTRYYKVKYSFIRDGEDVTVVSPAIYDKKDVENLQTFGTFIVKYIGKCSVIKQNR